MTWISFITTFGTALLTTGGLWALINSVFTKSGRAETAKIISEAQEVAQRTALESAAKSFTFIKAECDRCNARLEEVSLGVEALIDAVEAIRDILPTGDERTVALNNAVRVARRALY